MNKKSEFIIIGDIEIPIDFIPLIRKTISISVISSRMIKVKYPRAIGKAKARAFVNNRKNWIQKRVKLLEKAEINGTGRGIFGGRRLYFKGKVYAVETGNDFIHISENKFVIPAEYGIEEVDRWYKAQSVDSVGQFMRKYAKTLPTFTIKVKKQKNIWGSCNAKRRIYINSRISMCTPESIEYVLWHEICHLTYMNHSKSFYKLLETYCPEYKKQKTWLKENAWFLKI